MSSCWEARTIIGNARLYWAVSLRGHCVNVPHLPADLSPDWLLMTFLGHRHAKLFIYSKKKMPNANSLLDSMFPVPVPWVRVGITVLVSVSISWTVMMCYGHQHSLWYRNRPAVFLFVYVYMCVYVSVDIMHVTDMGHPWLLLRTWHVPTGYLVQKKKTTSSKLEKENKNVVDLCHKKWHDCSLFVDTGSLTAKGCTIAGFSLCSNTM